MTARIESCEGNSRYFSPWERAEVRAAAVEVDGLVHSTSVALTPALSQREREQYRSVAQVGMPGAHLLEAA
jgi:hypothetical protein